MLRAMSWRDETVAERVEVWLTEADDLVYELESGNHAYAVWRMVEGSDFVAQVLRPCLQAEAAEVAALDAYVELVWKRKLALAKNQEVQVALASLAGAVRHHGATYGWPLRPPSPDEEESVQTTIRDTNGEIHDAIDDHLARHMMALCALDFAEAARTWELLKAEFNAHGDAEDEHVVPFYESLGEFPPGGQPMMFTAEHNGIRRLMLKIEIQQEELRQQRDVRRKIVDSLDRYLMLRHLLEHHSLREQNILYPQLIKTVAVEKLEEFRQLLIDARPWQLLNPPG